MHPDLQTPKTPPYVLYSVQYVFPAIRKQLYIRCCRLTHPTIQCTVHQVQSIDPPYYTMYSTLGAVDFHRSRIGKLQQLHLELVSLIYSKGFLCFRPFLPNLSFSVLKLTHFFADNIHHHDIFKERKSFHFIRFFNFLGT